MACARARGAADQLVSTSYVIQNVSHSFSTKEKGTSGLTGNGAAVMEGSPEKFAGGLLAFSRLEDAPAVAACREEGAGDGGVRRGSRQQRGAEVAAEVAGELRATAVRLHNT